MAENKAKSEYAKREEKILEFWRENQIFKKTLNKRSPKGEFVFYEGPPTANGKPGIHHLEARSFKDAIPRYKTMRGYKVRRKGGWDTHGLPVELQVEKALGLDSKKAIEKYGIGKFNQKCKESVWEYVDLWEKFTDRIGYWVDLEDPYITYKNEYIESVWNIVGKVEEQKLLYKDYKVVPWCPRCGTGLSSHELAQGYKDVKDLSITAKFKVKSEKFKDTYLLAWTTTPWTLPGNVALAVGDDIDYVKVKYEDEVLVCAKERLSIFSEAPEIIGEFKGRDMVGLEYEPLYPFIKKAKPENIENAYKVYSADFVTTEDGTGIVHTAVMYGQDDFELGNKVGLPKYHLVDENGNFGKGTGPFKGRFVREEVDGKPTMAVDIIRDLQERNLFFSKENYEHSYPHCWRCKTPLIYYARDSWYIRMSDPKIKRRLISENKKIGWEPEHIREGRFGEWLREIKDWAISRERYWGTPLPVWEAEDGERLVIDSIAKLRENLQPNNTYLMVRHGQAESNAKNIVSGKVENEHHLTSKGKAQVEKLAKKLADKNIDLIISSPFLRTKETAEILLEHLSLPESALVIDERIKEIDTGDFNLKPISEYRKYFEDILEKFTKRPPGKGAETIKDVQKRVSDFIFDIDSKYQDKNILIVSHEYPLWQLETVAHGFSIKESASRKKMHSDYIDNAELRDFDFVPLPRNEEGELDLHRPYIDDVVLVKEGKEYKRVKEVMDVWFDSGAMPYAQDHYPFEGPQNLWQKITGKHKLRYPADFISEAIDQTRGWFYTLHAIGALTGKGRAYKNVICLGHLLDKDGKKMSKSLGNIVDPWEMADKYGVDSLRLWMYSVNAPGESKSFDEKTVQDIQRQVFGLFYNVLSFYELYRDKNLENNTLPKSENILDKWILARLNELIEGNTKHLDEYKLLEPVRAIREFVGDLSTWYLRRSRDRIKGGDESAKQVLYFVLKNTTQLLAPFTPFASEDIWQKLRQDTDPESVHLASWPATFASDKEVLGKMADLREIVSVGLKARQVKNIAVRQPLGTGVLRESLGEEYEEILKDELNIKEIKYHDHEELISLDFEITPELKEEGNYRELVRSLQDMRKKEGLTPDEEVTFLISTNKAGQDLVTKWQKEIEKTIGAKEIRFEGNDGKENKVGDLMFIAKILR